MSEVLTQAEREYLEIFARSVICPERIAAILEKLTRQPAENVPAS